MKLIILASKSPRRRQLLQQIRIDFEVVPALTEELMEGNPDPASLVCGLAEQKALDVASSEPDALIIGADTIVVLDSRILGKPADEDDARRMLRSLSGKTHTVYTAISLVKSGGTGEATATHTFFEKTNVTFSELSDSEISAYVAGGSPMDKAGAYGIQDDLGALFVERIEGDFYNVVGFPLNRFYNEMKAFAPEYLAEAEIFADPGNAKQ